MVKEWVGAASQAEETAFTIVRWCEKAWHIRGIGENQNSKAGRARRKVERDKTGPESRGQTSQGYEGPVKHFCFIHYHQRRAQEVFLKKVTYDLGFEDGGELQQAKEDQKGIPHEGNRVISYPKGGSSRY